MFEQIDKERFLKIYTYFTNVIGGSQERKLKEEQYELDEALIKFDNGIGDINEVVKEFADNFALLFQHMYVRDIELEEVYNALIEKLNRTDVRVVTRYYERNR